MLRKSLIFTCSIVLILSLGILFVTLGSDVSLTSRALGRAQMDEILRPGSIWFIALTLLCAVLSSSAILWKLRKAESVLSWAIVGLLTLQTVLGILDLYWFSILTFVQVVLYWVIAAPRAHTQSDQ